MPIEGDRRRDVALFRFALVREAADPQLSPRRRGELVRAIASQDHLGPDGTRLRVSRPSIDRWIRAWRRGGFAGLYPKPRKGILRTPEDVLALAERLKKENPRRTAAQVRAILLRLDVEAPSERTLQVFTGVGQRDRSVPTGASRRGPRGTCGRGTCCTGRRRA